ncbi:hypothetical protein CC78DRAFT_545025 [Lojkania enalia]|uniref:C2H2-type domain-containing protein n=1 Tax=Lojkania enalia TaxID=147567 RepID=A0A9P4N3D3_9PLEO|nr:hypothetical protein CC78DRAFT_545025 [Didymosphaeria enalia]
MHPGSDPMGAPPSFAARRPNAAHLGNFELPPPQMHKYTPFNTVNASQSSQAPTTIASVGNLLTPPNNIPGDVSPASGVSTTSVSSSAMPQYAQHTGGYMYSPHSQGSAGYSYSGASQQQNQYNPGRGLNPPPYEMNQQLPPFPPSSTPQGAPSNLPTMPTQQQPHHMMGAHTPVSTSAPQQPPAHAQEPFNRPPPTPTTYYGSQPSTTPQQSSFPYSTGPSPTQQSPISAGGQVPRMSPAVSQGTIPSVPSGPAQSPHAYQRSYGALFPPAPVFSNVANPNGQLALVGGMPHGMMPGFNSGHAASMPHFLGHSQQPPTATDRPFKCDQCPQSFNRNHDLKRHKRIHLAVKPFPCNHCDKSFSRKDALKRHILVKGCGKVASNGDDVKRESHSPDHKNQADSVDTKPIISSHA